MNTRLTLTWSAKLACAIANSMKDVAVMARKKSLDISVCNEDPLLFFWNSVYECDDDNDDVNYDGYCGGNKMIIMMMKHW